VEPLDPRLYRDLVRRALDEDVRDGDVTTEAIVPAGVQARGTFLIKSEGVLAGLDVAFEVFRQLDRGPVGSFAVRVRDGEWCQPGTEVADVVAPARTLLVGERTALNFLQRMSGIATLARRFAEAANGRIAILDTRKTTPTLRALEKYAVRVGGGANHRFGLDDAVLIKDNHIAAAGGIMPAVERVRAGIGHLVKVEVEVDTLSQIEDALAAGVDAVLLDNMQSEALRRAVAMVDGRAITEASGGITPATAPEIAATGVDLISIGWLTHSVTALDIGLDYRA